jgi:hypothetical protein
MPVREVLDEVDFPEEKGVQLFEREPLVIKPTHERRGR